MENKGNSTKKYELKQIEVRLKVKESDPIYSQDPIDCAEKAVKLLSDFMKNMDREYVYILNCDSKMRPLSYSMVSMGGMNYAPIDPANIFKTALLSNAANIIIMHVHPSGDFMPSKEDKEVTKCIAAAGRMMGIPVQDHLVVAAGSGQFYSMRLNMPELFIDRIEKVQIIGESIPQVRDSATIDTGLYNKVINFLEKQQDLMTNSPEAWNTAKEIAILTYEIKNQQIDSRDYETQKYIVETAEKIRDNDTDGLKIFLADLGEKVTDIEQARKAFSLIVKLSTLNEWQPASIEAIQAFEKSSDVMIKATTEAMTEAITEPMTVPMIEAMTESKTEPYTEEISRKKAEKEGKTKEAESIETSDNTASYDPNEKTGAISFREKLEEKSREAAEINNARAMKYQQTSQYSRQAI